MNAWMKFVILLLGFVFGIVAVLGFLLVFRLPFNPMLTKLQEPGITIQAATPTTKTTNTPTATPTNTPTATPTNTPTATPTNTPTATPTNTPTATPTNTPRATPTNTPTATPTNTPRATPTPTAVIPQTQPQTGGSVCRADKIATWSEVGSAGPHRLEITVKDGVLHLDYYPNRGVPSVSVIVREHEEVELIGFGSAWYFPARDCSQYNNIEDATNYAKGRRQWNHSGLVYGSLTDYLQGNPPVVNLYNTDSNRFKPVLAPITTTTIVPDAQPGCPPAREMTYYVPTDFTVNGPAIVHPWWNNGKPSFGQLQVRVKLGSGETATFLGAMGKSYKYLDNPACNNNLDAEFAIANFPIKTIAQLKSEGLVR